MLSKKHDHVAPDSIPSGQSAATQSETEMSTVDEVDPIWETSEEEEKEEEEGNSKGRVKSDMLGQKQIRVTEGASAGLSAQPVTGIHDGSIIREHALASLWPNLWGSVPSSQSSVDVDMKIPSSELLLEAAAFSRSMIVIRDQETSAKRIAEDEQCAREWKIIFDQLSSIESIPKSEAISKDTTMQTSSQREAVFTTQTAPVLSFSTKGPAEDEQRAREWRHKLIHGQLSSLKSIPMSKANSENTTMQTSSRREAAFTTRNAPALSFDSTPHEEKSKEGSFDTAKKRPSVLQKTFAEVTAAAVTTGKDKSLVETLRATHDNNRKRKLKLMGPENGSEGPSEPKESAPMGKTDPESGSDLQLLMSDREFHNVTSALDALVQGGTLGPGSAWRVLIAVRGPPGAGQ